MKHIITIISLIICPNIWAQDTNILINELWGMQEHYAINEENNLRSDFYNVNSEENIDNYEGFEYNFQNTGILNIKVNDNINEDKTWELYSAGDSLKLDNSKYKVISLTSNELILRSTVEQFDLPFDYYFKLIPSSTLKNDDFNFNRYVEIYPNPTNGSFLNLKFYNTIIGKLKEATIIDVFGKYILTTPLNKSELNQKIALNNLRNGIYFIKIINDKNTAIAVKKIVINK